MALARGGSEARRGTATGVKAPDEKRRSAKDRTALDVDARGG